MTKPELPSVVAFDVYDTLTIWRPELAVLAADHGYTISEVLAGSSDIAISADHGEITYHEYGALMEERWGFTGYVERIAQGFRSISIMHELAHDFHAAGSTLVLASNAGAGALRLSFEANALPHVGIFSRIFESCKIGHAKPHPSFFAHVLRETGIEPARHLFIDDSADNVSAARAAGMQAERMDVEDPEGTAQGIRQLYLPNTVPA